MMADWRDMLTVPGLLLLTGVAVVNLYLWVFLITEIKQWRRRRSRLAYPRLQVQQHLPPPRSPLPLFFTTLLTGIISAWMLTALQWLM